MRMSPPGVSEPDPAGPDRAGADGSRADGSGADRGGPAWYSPEPERFRQVLGHFATGVSVITGISEGAPVGFACQAFAALSLTPPLVLFCPSVTSTTWPRIAAAGVFCVNVLADSQRDLARRFGVSRPDKFDGVGWQAAPSGAPVLDGALTWAGCHVQAVHEAGDHFVVLGLVNELGDCHAGQPLVFYRGRFATAAPLDAAGPPEVVDTLLAWPRHADWM
jgi:3-hydroxy-9,10-secoandrosta-1,3,5(10)-triene-9,17-dione monooxygenase reductase component